MSSNGPVAGRDSKEWARERMRGLWSSPMVAFNEDLTFSEPGLRQNIDRLLAVGVDGMGFGFSEPWHLSHSERREGMEGFLGAVDGRVPAYIHATDHSVENTIDNVRFAKSLGASAVMLWVPYEFAKSQEMAIEWFEYICSETDSPVILYNTLHSGLKLSVDTMERISRIPAVAAVKNGVNDFAQSAALFERVGEQIVVSEPLEQYLPMSIQHLGQQVMLGTTSVYLMQGANNRPIRDYADAFWRGDSADGWRIYNELQPLRAIWEEMYTVLWDSNQASHPVGLIKCWMDAIGMYGGPSRPPATGVPSSAREWLMSKLQNSGWLERLSA